MPTVIKKLDAGQYQLKDQVVSINRVTKVVKGGKNLSFAALVVVGDPTAAVVGYGTGKAKKLAEIVAAALLGGEISMGAAIAANEFVAAHERYGRNRPK